MFSQGILYGLRNKHKMFQSLLKLWSRQWRAAKAAVMLPLLQLRVRSLAAAFSFNSSLFMFMLSSQLWKK